MVLVNGDHKHDLQTQIGCAYSRLSDNDLEQLQIGRASCRERVLVAV